MSLYFQESVKPARKNERVAVVIGIDSLRRWYLQTPTMEHRIFVLALTSLRPEHHGWAATVASTSPARSPWLRPGTASVPLCSPVFFLSQRLSLGSPAFFLYHLSGYSFSYDLLLRRRFPSFFCDSNSVENHVLITCLDSCDVEIESEWLENELMSSFPLIVNIYVHPERTHPFGD